MPRDCRSCEGTGRSPLGRTCPYCEGRGRFPDFSADAILPRVLSRKGPNKGKLRSQAPPKRGIWDVRAYYVWRMARFHGGADTRMPIMAGVLATGDPYREELDALAEKIARQTFGTDKAAANRWRGLI